MIVRCDHPDAMLYSGCLVDGVSVYAEMAEESEGWAIIITDELDRHGIPIRKLVRGKVELQKRTDL